MDKTFDAFHAMPFTQPETILPKILKYVNVLSINETKLRCETIFIQ